MRFLAFRLTIGWWRIIFFWFQSCRRRWWRRKFSNRKNNVIVAGINSVVWRIWLNDLENYKITKITKIIFCSKNCKNWVTRKKSITIDCYDPSRFIWLWSAMIVDWLSISQCRARQQDGSAVASSRQTENGFNFYCYLFSHFVLNLEFYKNPEIFEINEDDEDLS